jgi:hypothetical protein
VTVVHDLFPEIVRSGLWRLHHLYHLGEIVSFSGFERCYYFLCHLVFVFTGYRCLLPAVGSWLLNFLVECHAAKDRIEFLQLYPFAGVLLVLGSDITGSSRLAAVFVLGALQYHLYPIASFCHGSVSLIIKPGSRFRGLH